MEINLRIILQSPPPGVDFALQQGSGNNYQTVQLQRSTGEDLHYAFPIKVKDGKNGEPDFAGPFVQGPAGERFVYLDIGRSAGQMGSIWQRRLKIPLRGINHEMVNKLIAGKQVLETTVPGTAKDGSPTCATVKPFDGWKLNN